MQQSYGSIQAATTLEKKFKSQPNLQTKPIGSHLTTEAKRRKKSRKKWFLATCLLWCCYYLHLLLKFPGLQNVQLLVARWRWCIVHLCCIAAAGHAARDFSCKMDAIAQCNAMPCIAIYFACLTNSHNIRTATKTTTTNQFSATSAD